VGHTVLNLTTSFLVGGLLRMIVRTLYPLGNIKPGLNFVMRVSISVGRRGEYVSTEWSRTETCCKFALALPTRRFTPGKAAGNATILSDMIYHLLGLFPTTMQFPAAESYAYWPAISPSV
jgi:hypothetical protein